MPQNPDLDQKNALVCGSTRGIGKACAIALAQRGARITLAARNENALKTVRAELEQISNANHDYLIADFRDPENLRAAIKSYLARTADAPFHILINNTGGPPGGLAINAEIEEFQSAFSNHLICNHILVKALLDGMKAAKYGRIINIISTSVKQPLSNLGVSNTIRGAVANWAKTLANELGGFGVTVNNILPGATRTERLLAIIKNKAERSGISQEEAENLMLADIPAGRFAEPEEVAAAVAFLASPDAGYVNGINLPVDGGRTGCL